MKNFTVFNYIDSHINLFKKIDLNNLEAVISYIALSIEENRNIFVCGNGGSASTASHIVTDWAKMLHFHTGKSVNFHCLNDNIGLVTAYANDHSYDVIFSKQLEIFSKKDDLLITLSGSGNSQNIINALKYANDNDINTIAFVGYDGGQAKKLSDMSIHYPSFDMQLCEDFHLMINHMVMKKICNLPII